MPFGTGSGWGPPADLPSLKRVKRLGFDTETKDVDLKRLGPGFRRDAHVVGFSLALDVEGPRMYVPVRHCGGGTANGNLDEGIVRRWALSELNEFDGELVGAKLDYDLDAMAASQFGVTFSKVKKFRDVMVAETLLDEWRFSYSLDSIGKDRVKAGKAYDHVRSVLKLHGYNNEAEFKANLWRHPAWDTGEYAEGDADLPMRILDVQLAEMAKEDANADDVHLLDVFDLECDLIPILVAMRTRGVRVDLDRAERIRRELVVEREKHLTILRRLAGPQAEFMAPESFSKCLGDRGLQYPLTPKTHKPSITKEWLNANKGDEAVDSIIGGRRVDYIINTFVDGHIFTHSIKGRVHPTFKQLKGAGDLGEGDDDASGTIGRFSSENPNLQNIPARDPYLGPLIRSMFVPEEDEDWESADSSQIEYRGLVSIAVGKGADEARRKYNEDPRTDFHVMCGEFLGADAEDSFVRKRVKNTNFCKVYGGGVAKLALTFGCSIPEAKAFSDKYDEALPFVKETMRKATKWALKRGFVTDVLGRKQRFPFWERKRRLKDENGRFIYEDPLPYDQALEAYGRPNNPDGTLGEPNPRLIQRAWGHKALNRKLQASAASQMKKAMVDSWKAGVNSVLGPMLVTVHDEGNHSVPRTKEGHEAAAEFKRIFETCIPLRVPVIVNTKRGPNWGSCE